jgi:hypothetical protein
VVVVVVVVDDVVVVGAAAPKHVLAAVPTGQAISIHPAANAVARTYDVFEVTTGSAQLEPPPPPPLLQPLPPPPPP